jgi:hypothetical protein
MSKSLILLTTCYLLLTTLFVSCDKLDAPYTEKNNTTVTSEKHILLEEFTGFKCVNCPRGHRILDSLGKIYGANLVSYSIHAKGYFTNPDQSGNFTYDFRNADGNELDKKFQVSLPGLPEGMINRITYGNSKAVGPDNWGTHIEEALKTQPLLDIQLKSEYDIAFNDIYIRARVTALEDISKQINLSVYVIEDSIQAPQQDNSTVILDYYHRNVLRGSVNGTYGEKLNDDVIQKDDIITKTYDYTLNNIWNYKQIYIIAFAYYQDNNEIIQAQKLKLNY